jgi:hypothetical protein
LSRSVTKNTDPPFAEINDRISSFPHLPHFVLHFHTRNRFNPLAFLRNARTIQTNGGAIFQRKREGKFIKGTGNGTQRGKRATGSFGMYWKALATVTAGE